MAHFDEQSILDFLLRDEIDDAIDFAFPAPNIRREGSEVTVPFIKSCLDNLGWSDLDLAGYSSIHIDLIRAILNEEIPLSSLERDVLSEMANALGYDISTFDLLIEYDNPTPEPIEIVDQLIKLGLGNEESIEIGYNFTSKGEYLADLQKELLRLLLDSLADYESSDKQDQKLKHKYQNLIDRIQSMIGTYQTEIDDVKSKVDSIRAEYEVEVESMKSIVEQLRKIQTLGNIIGLDEKPKNPANVAIEPRGYGSNE